MQVHVTVTSAELIDMKMTAKELEASVLQTLDEHAVDAKGDRCDYSGFNVSIEVMPTAREFAASLGLTK